MGRVGLSLFLNGLFGQILIIVIVVLVPGRNSNPINRQAGISENVYITVQNDTYGVEQRVCSIDSMTYEDGESIPTSSPCEHCLCRPPGFACTIISCEYRPGCKSIKRSDQCCPEYQCECEKDGKIYQNGEKILDDNNPCEVCYCQGGDVICAVIDCYWRSDCQPRYIENRCCPLYDHCPPPSGSHIGPIRSTTQKPSSTSHHGISWFNMSSAIYATPSTVPTTKKPLALETTTLSIPIIPIESTTDVPPTFPQLSPETLAQNEVIVSQEQPEEMASASEVSVAVEKKPSESPTQAPIQPETINVSTENFPTSILPEQINASTEDSPAPTQPEAIDVSTEGSLAPIQPETIDVSNKDFSGPIQPDPINVSTDDSPAPIKPEPINFSSEDAPTTIQPEPINVSTEASSVVASANVSSEAEIVQPVELPPPVQVSSSINVNPNVSVNNEQKIQFFEETVPTTVAPPPLPQDDTNENESAALPVIPETTTLIPGPELTVELDTALQSLVNQINENESSIVPLDGLHPNDGAPPPIPETVEPTTTTAPTPEVVKEAVEDHNDDSLILLVPSTEATEEPVPQTTSLPPVPIVDRENEQVGPNIQQLDDSLSQTLVPEPEDLTTPIPAEAVTEDVLFDENFTTTPTTPSIIDLIPSEIIQSQLSNQTQTPSFQPSVVHSINDGVTEVVEVIQSSTSKFPVQQSTSVPTEQEELSTTIQNVVKEDEVEVTTNAGDPVGVETLVESEVPATTTTPAKIEESPVIVPQLEVLDQSDPVDDAGVYEPEVTTVFPEAVVFDEAVSTTLAPVPVAIKEEEKIKDSPSIPSIPSVNLEPPSHDFWVNPNKVEIEEQEIVTEALPTPPPTDLVPPVHEAVSNPPPQIQSFQKEKIPDEKIPVVFVDLETGLTESPTEFGAVGSSMPIQPSPEEVGEGGMLNDENEETTVGTLAQVSVQPATSTGESISAVEITTVVPAPEKPDILYDQPEVEEVEQAETTTVFDTNAPLADDPLESNKGNGPNQNPNQTQAEQDAESPIPNDHAFYLSTSTSTKSPVPPTPTTTELVSFVEDEEAATTEAIPVDSDSDFDQISFDESGSSSSLVVPTTTNEPPKFRNDIVESSNEETTPVPLLSRHHLPNHKGQDYSEPEPETTTFQPEAEEVIKIKVNQSSTTVSPPLPPIPSLSPKFILPDHLVKRVDPISDDLPLQSGGGQGGQGKSDYLSLGEDAENEVANTEETWFWRTYSKLRTLFPSSSESRSARKPRSPDNDNISIRLKSKLAKSNSDSSDPPFLTVNGKKVLVKNNGILGGNKHKELKYWTSPRFMIW